MGLRKQLRGPARFGCGNLPRIKPAGRRPRSARRRIGIVPYQLFGRGAEIEVIRPRDRAAPFPTPGAADPFMSVIATSSSAGSAAAAPAGSGALDAQKAQCERQLSDWVNCVSSKTPEGKAKIAEYSSKLSAINTQIKKADDARAQLSPGAARQADAAKANAPKQTSALSTIGSVIDTYA
jgi:hypothetical protein